MNRKQRAQKALDAYFLTIFPDDDPDTDYDLFCLFLEDIEFWAKGQGYDLDEALENARSEVDDGS